MKVTLINYTGIGFADAAKWAAAQLIFAKSTRLTMRPGLLDDILSWSQSKIDQELEYIANTIPSSWEFIDYTFMIEGVSRAFTHQFVRSRTFSFAQQTMRILDVSEGAGWDYLTGPSLPARTPYDATTIYDQATEARYEAYHGTMHAIDQAYKTLIANGAEVEDARGILPTNILTNIVANCNMRSFVELVRKRSSGRVQGEYREALEAMKQEALAVHPFLRFFIERDFDRAAQDLEQEIADLPREKRIRILKLLDQMRSQS